MSGRLPPLRYVLLWAFTATIVLYILAPLAVVTLNSFSSVAYNVFPPEGLSLRLLTQPRWLGYSFNPVTFWLAMDGAQLIAAVAEVDTPFGDRHSYLCHRPDFAPIGPGDRITAPKALHVSPFQEVTGSYTFGFDVTADRITILINHTNGERGLVATLAGTRAPLTARAILGATLRRPFGAARTMALIHGQALKLRLKGAPYRRRPSPPDSEITTCSS